MSEIDPCVVADFERETWGRCAESYLDTFSGITRETVPILIEAADIRPGRTALDIGSGPGHVADALSHAGAEVTGVDFSAEMVAVARRQYPGVTFAEADAEDLPFDPDSFDAVVSNFVVHHLARPVAVFKECHRVLKPGGRFAFVVFGAPEKQSSLRAFFAAVEAHHSLDEFPHGPLFGVTDRGVYEPMLSAGGFEDCRLDTHDIAWRSKTLEAVIQGCWTWGDMARLPHDVQGKIETDMRANSRPYDQGTEYVFPHSVLVGTAMKA